MWRGFAVGRIGFLSLKILQNLHYVGRRMLKAVKHNVIIGGPYKGLSITNQQMESVNEELPTLKWIVPMDPAPCGS